MAQADLPTGNIPGPLEADPPARHMGCPQPTSRPPLAEIDPLENAKDHRTTMPYQQHDLPASDPRSPDYAAWREACRRSVAAQRAPAAYGKEAGRHLAALAERYNLSDEELARRLHEQERARYAYSAEAQERYLAAMQAQAEAEERLRAALSGGTGDRGGHKAEAESWIEARRREAMQNEETRIARERAKERAGSDVPWDIKHAPADLTLLEVKTVGGVARFTGYASVFGNLDLTGDIVQPGAFTKTLADARAKGRSILYPVLYQHQSDRLIGGIVAAREDHKGLAIEGILAVDTAAGHEAFSLAQKGILSGLSIGYKTMRSDYDRAGNRRLNAVKLHEISLVAAPANPAAGVDHISY